MAGAALAYDRAVALTQQAVEKVNLSQQLRLESQRLRQEAQAIRQLGRHMPGANGLTVLLTWQILQVRGLLTRRELGEGSQTNPGAPGFPEVA